jgi:hypothetical protein
MPRNKRQGHKQPGTPEADSLPCRVTIVPAPATPTQLAAWRQIWARLLGHIDPIPETPQPQDQIGLGATNIAAVASGLAQVTKEEASERVDALLRGEGGA